MLLALTSQRPPLNLEHSLCRYRDTAHIRLESGAIGGPSPASEAGKYQPRSDYLPSSRSVWKRLSIDPSHILLKLIAIGSLLTMCRVGPCRVSLPFDHPEPVRTSGGCHGSLLTFRLSARYLIVHNHKDGALTRQHQHHLFLTPLRLFISHHSSSGYFLLLLSSRSLVLLSSLLFAPLPSTICKHNRV